MSSYFAQDWTAIEVLIEINFLLCLKEKVKSQIQFIAWRGKEGLVI